MWTLSTTGLLILRARPAHKQASEEEELQVARGDDEQTEGCGPPGDVLGVGPQQEVVCTLPHAAEAVVTEHVEDTVLHYVGCSLE